MLDMDGVIYTGSKLIPGAVDFVGRLKQRHFKFLFLTNNSYYTPKQLKERLFEMGINVTEDCFYTSAMATASFLKTQKPVNCSVYVIGGQGIIEEFEKISRSKFHKSSSQTD